MPSNPGSAVVDVADPAELAAFELDVQVTLDAAAGSTVRRCDTSDGCGSTCASACTSN